MIRGDWRPKLVGGKLHGLPESVYRAAATRVAVRLMVSQPLTTRHNLFNITAVTAQQGMSAPPRPSAPEDLIYIGVASE